MTELVIYSDMSCRVYANTELIGIASAEEEFVVRLNKGAYCIELVSEENSADHIEFDFHTDGTNYKDLRKIAIRPIRFNRLVSPYDDVGQFHCGYANVVKSNLTVGCINRFGDLIYDDSFPFGEDKLCVCKNQLWGIIDSNGDVIVELKYEMILPIESGSAIIISNEKYGLINSNAEIVVPTKYDYLYYNQEVKAICCVRNGKYGMMNLEGINITPIKYDVILAHNLPYITIGRDVCFCSYFTDEGILCDYEGGKWGVVDVDGFEIISCKYDSPLYFYKGLSITQLNGKYGLVDNNGVEIIPVIYEEIEGFVYFDADSWNMRGERFENAINRGVIKVQLNGKWGCVDLQGNVVVPCKYDDEMSYEEWIGDLLCVRCNNKYGYVNKQGIEIIPCKYDSIGSINDDGIARVEIDGKWGCVDVQGNVVIPCKYDDISAFSNNIVTVKIDGKWGCIDMNGREIIPVIYDKIGDFRENIAAAQLNGKWGFIDKNGRLTVACKYDEVSLLEKGLAKVKLNGKLGFIDRNGNEIIAVIYEDISHVYCTDNYDVKLNDKWGCIDSRGNSIIPCEFEQIIRRRHEVLLLKKRYNRIENFYDGLARVSDEAEFDIYDDVYRGGKYGYINESGEEVIPLIYDYAYDFSQDIAIVEKNGSCRLINKNGSTISGLYNRIYPFREGLALFSSGGEEYRGPDGEYYVHGQEYGYMNIEGKIVIDCLYHNAESFSEGLAAVMIKGKWGFIDHTGKEIIQCKYQCAHSFREGLAAVKLNGRWGFINKFGAEVIPLKYDMVRNRFNNGKVSVMLNKKIYYLNRYGAVISIGFGIL